MPLPIVKRREPSSGSRRYLAQPGGCPFGIFGEYLKSTDFYTVAINLEPDNADLYNNRGFDFLNAKEYEKARN
ncbi:MAG: tetratricopeptide repeat protein [Nitratireductor sp.]